MSKGTTAGCGGKSSEGRKAYERMRYETKPRGGSGTKPLREWETLRADGAGEASQYNDLNL